jgi:hypothetical protein
MARNSATVVLDLGPEGSALLIENGIPTLESALHAVGEQLQKKAKEMDTISLTRNTGVTFTYELRFSDPESDEPQVRTPISRLDILFEK